MSSFPCLNTLWVLWRTGQHADNGPRVQNTLCVCLGPLLWAQSELQFFSSEEISQLRGWWGFVLVGGMGTTHWAVEDLQLLASVVTLVSQSCKDDPRVTEITCKSGGHHGEVTEQYGFAQEWHLQYWQPVLKLPEYPIYVGLGAALRKRRGLQLVLAQPVPNIYCAAEQRSKDSA